MTNPLTELALEELEADAQGTGREDALALVGRWRAGSATAADVQVLKQYMDRIAAEVMKAAAAISGN